MSPPSSSMPRWRRRASTAASSSASGWACQARSGPRRAPSPPPRSCPGGWASPRPVRVDNDANLGALAEHIWGAGLGASEMVYIKVATGIGAGLVFGGRLYAGVGGTAGEIGHTIIDEHGPVCRCANRGCLETLASGAATLELLRPTLGDDLTLGRLVDMTVQGDPACRRVVADAGRHLGR